MFDYLAHPLLTGLRSQLLCGAGVGEPNPAATTASSDGSQTECLQAMLAKVAEVDGRGLDDSHRLEALEWLERLKSAAAAAQARVTVQFKASQIDKQRAEGVPVKQLGRGVSAQVALARRDSPFRAARLVGLAEALVREMPETLTALTRGDTSEWRATLVVRETACLRSEHRSAVDAELGSRLPDFGDRRTEAEARRCAYRLDPHSATRRAAAAAADRRVSLRPAPDVMSKLSALLPVKQGVAAYAALRLAADSARAAGDPRTRGQVMADELVRRVTGQSEADDVPIEIQLVMTDVALFDGDAEPAVIPGFGPVPAPTARSWVHGKGADPAASQAESSEARRWLRRLYCRPDTGELVAMESHRRCFPERLRRLLVARDELCRMPWCEAPIRHADHVVPFGDGAPTRVANGQGLCESCNHSKQAPGWISVRHADGSITVTTPSGKTYSSRPRPLPGGRRRWDRRGGRAPT